MEEIPIIKDVGFWELLATIAGGAVVYFVKQYLEDTKKNFEKMESTFENIQQILNSVVVKNETQEVKIDQHEKRLEKLESKL